MGALGILAILLSSLLLLYLLSNLLKFLNRVWWTPIRIQKLMNSQGIKGPSYRFIHGNSKEIIRMSKESMSKPMSDLSHNMYARVQPHIQSWMKTYGEIFLYWMGPQAQLVVSNPELIREIMNNKEKIYHGVSTQLYMKKLVGDGLVASEGEKWIKMRKLANYAFQGESLKSMIPAMVASAEMMLERLKKNSSNEIEVVQEFRLFTSEVISRTAFGSSYKEGKNIFDLIMKLALLINRNAFKFNLPVISEFLKNGDEVEANKLEKEIERSILEIIRQREDKLMKGEIENFGDDFLGLLLKGYHEDDEHKRISIQDVIDECKTFYAAGQETTNILLYWTALLLAIHRDWQEKARNEVFKFLGHQTPNADGIAKLKTMGMIINETLRLYPPVVGFTRKAEREVILGNITVPTEINLYISSLAVHQNPNIWGEDVHLFKPERFSEGVLKATNNQTAAYLPFGLGPRTCVGFNFAIAEAKIVLSVILQRYAFTLSPSYVHSPIEFLPIRPQHGIQVILHPLENDT